MANSETLNLHQQAERLQEWRDGFQAVYVITTGVQTGFFDQFAAHPQGLTVQELAQRTACHTPYVEILVRQRLSLSPLGCRPRTIRPGPTCGQSPGWTSAP